MIDLQAKITQSEFGNLVGVSQPAVSDMLARKVMSASGKWTTIERCGGRQAQGDALAHL